MQGIMNGFIPEHVARLLAVSRAYFCADFASLHKGKKSR